MTFKEKVIDNINVFLSAYAIAFVIRLFLVEAYQIPSQSMVPSLLVKDILMVEKVTMGSRIPVFNWKVPGLLQPERNDIIVFVSPAWKSPGIDKELVSLFSLSLINLDNTFAMPKNLVKRLVGLPGDRIYMTNQDLFINGIPVDVEPVRMAVPESSYEQLEKRRERLFFNMYREEYQGKKRIVQHLYEGIPVMKGDFTGISAFRGIAADNEEAYYQSQYLALAKRELRNNSFPEIYVPRKGDVIKLKEKNDFYKGLLELLIERESGRKVTLENGSFFIDGKEITEWKVMNNYYFCMGDDRDLSYDCRYFGFIPEKNIFGKPLFRYWPFTRLGFSVDENADTVKRRSYED